MSIKSFLHRSVGATVAVALTAGPIGPAYAGGASRVVRPALRAGGHAARVASLPAGAQRPTSEVLLSIGQGELITLPAAATDVWVSNPGAADVYISNPHQIHLFGKEFGEATVFATSASGEVVYATNVRVSQNITSIDRMMKVAMPDADIKITTVGQIAVLNGIVASPEDSAQAERLVTSLLNPGIDTSNPSAALKIAVVNRLHAATPLQVNLQVKFAEVSRNFVKNIGVNLQNRGVAPAGKPLFNITQGRQGTISTQPGAPIDHFTPNGTPVDAQGNPVPYVASGLLPGATSYGFPAGQGIGTAIGIAGHLFGADLLTSLDLGERNGQVTTLANPNLTAISGETGTFLAGGQIPIPVSQGLGAVSVEYKDYGISLAYTPTVLADGRISLRVRPEVSELTSAGAVQLNGTTIPALTTRRAETTVELGSGQSLMIAGLIQNNHNNSIDQTPGLGDVPVLGALFRSNSWQRGETELVIVITPYLVKPVNANEIKLPTDGYEAPTDLGRVFLGNLGGGKSGGDRPKPSMDTGSGAAPGVGNGAPAPAAPANDPRQRPDAIDPKAPPPNSPRADKTKPSGAAPGFSLN
ncbi:type II and III secretion system protein family protein [Sphingomonas sp. GlSt437]|uniref:type II and III secretion system protein family protein n=1 Tax=Sphingomonas sp. GlSt437 TaxID=3389970 RepID=UPI003A85583D